MGSEKHTCPFCRTIAVPAYAMESDYQAGLPYTLRTIQCASCDEITFYVVRYDQYGYQLDDERQVIPIEGRAPANFSFVPEEFTDDYHEACTVLRLSPKSAAALARRSLQAVLAAEGYASRDLAKQIDAVIGERDPDKVLPRQLRGNVDAIRNYGNFSAHRINDQTTFQVIDVEEGGS
jgi:hypothetical protein